MNLFSLIPASLKEKIRLRLGAITTRSRLANLKRAGFAPRLIIDAGAFHGEWASLAREIFPSADLLLIEPQPHLAPQLTALCAKIGRASLQSVLIGRAPAEATFVIAASNSRITTSDYQPAHGERMVTLPIRSLADIAASSGFADCDFLKLDLQGHELEALAGAGELFGRAEVILIEISWIPIGGTPLLAEVIDAFTAKGYRAYDIFGHNHRPRDGALWQTDIIFVRHDSPLIASSDWS